MTAFLADTSVLNRVGRASEVADSDYESIARERGQAVEWVVPRGSID